MRKLARSSAPASAIVAAGIVLAVTLYSRVGDAQEQRPAPVSPARRVDFDKQVKPILEANCLECHSAEKRKGGLSLATYEDVLDGGRSGAIVRPGLAGRSLMLSRIKGDPDLGDRMPLENEPLSDADVRTLTLWIDQGAR